MVEKTGWLVTSYPQSGSKELSAGVLLLSVSLFFCPGPIALGTEPPTLGEGVFSPQLKQSRNFPIDEPMGCVLDESRSCGHSILTIISPLKPQG